MRGPTAPQSPSRRQATRGRWRCTRRPQAGIFNKFYQETPCINFPLCKIPSMKKPPYVIISLSFPKDLTKTVSRLAVSTRRSRSALMADLVEEALRARQAAEGKK